MGIILKKGFTIVELLIVVVVIAILATIVVVAYNGVANRASDSSAKSNAETFLKKLEVQKVTTETYPLAISSLGIADSPDIRTEYNSDGKSYCVTTSSIRAKTNYYSDSSTVAIQTGTCPNHIGYAGGAGSFNSTSIFGSSSPTGSYAVYNDGGGDIWIGNRFYTFRDKGVRVVGARVWEPASSSQAFLSSPLSFRIYTQDWTGVTLGGWGTLGSPDLSATYSGTRTAGSWTYIWFPTSVTINKVTASAGQKDVAVVAVRYEGNYYVAASPQLADTFIESNQMSGIYLSEHGDVGRSVSNVYPHSGPQYYGIDIIVMPQ